MITGNEAPSELGTLLNTTKFHTSIGLRKKHIINFNNVFTREKKGERI